MEGSFRAPVAAVVGVGAFALYWSTLLPGFDFGDTASFQVMAGSAAITPRDGYPLFFAIGALFTWLVSGEPAYALNLASAAAAAVACGAIVLLAFELSGSLAAAVVAATVFGGSYTFWSQSVIAEVYALHVCLIVCALLLLLRWEHQPTLARLATFFAAYALSFGNHLSMLLLVPGCVLFLLTTAPGGWRAIVAPRVVALAAAIATLGSLQYLWNLRNLWLLPHPPATVASALGAFWFDVTKADWRSTMVLEVPSSMTLERLRMYTFDVGQQFGWLFPVVALVGFYALARRNWNRAILVGVVYAANVLFALGYNVGDSHVFFLPSHLMIALLVAPGLVHLDRLASAQRGIIIVALVVAGVHVWRDYPALDRSGDTRPALLLDRLTDGLDDRNAILLTDLNWQVQNGLTYYAQKSRTDLAFARMPEVLLYAPALFQDNRAINREFIVSERAGDELKASYGPLFSSAPDPRVPAQRLSDLVLGIPPGTRYVLCVLRPTREFTVDVNDLARSLERLTGGRTPVLPEREFIAIAGITGAGVSTVMADDRSFRQTTTLDGVRVDIRMESWLAFDTIRRMGFGQVIAARRHTLIVERGVSFVAFDTAGRPVRTTYQAGIFAPEQRWIVGPR
ncbi:MAG: DUF2723 domain-containing protein [Luteitalea sp.]|nr:DUF2723 domain-containing protein [Luteitalea sp.]